MTGRERVIAAIERTAPDRIPRYDGFWEDTFDVWAEQGLQLPQVETITIDGRRKNIGTPADKYFDFDFSPLYMDISMRFQTGLVADDGEKITVADRCGYTAQKYKGKSSTMAFLSHRVETPEDWQEHKHRLTLEYGGEARVDCESYFLHTAPYPSWDGVGELFREYRKLEKFMPLTVYGPWEAAWRHHGYEDSLMDLIAEPEMMAEMFMAFTDLTIAVVEKMISIGCKPDGVWLIEDMGGTHTTLFSPKVYKELLWPCHKKLGDYLKEKGLYFLMHSCGYIEPLLPDLIAAGLQVIQAIQANTGMDLVDLKPKYGEKLTFFGNISEQKFHMGEVAIEEELRRKIPVAMEGGGYLYHSDHSIPPEVSLKTYLHAMKILDEIGVYA